MLAVHLTKIGTRVDTSFMIQPSLNTEERPIQVTIEAIKMSANLEVRTLEIHTSPTMTELATTG